MTFHPIDVFLSKSILVDTGESISNSAFCLNQVCLLPEGPLAGNRHDSALSHGTAPPRMNYRTLEKRRNLHSKELSVGASTPLPATPAFILTVKHLNSSTSSPPLCFLLLLPRMFFPQTFMWLMLASCRGSLFYCSLSKSATSPPSHSLTPCPILFSFKGLISTCKYNSCCSSLTGYLQRTVW